MFLISFHEHYISYQYETDNLLHNLLSHNYLWYIFT